MCATGERRSSQAATDWTLGDITVGDQHLSRICIAACSICICIHLHRRTVFVGTSYAQFGGPAVRRQRLCVFPSYARRWGRAKNFRSIRSPSRTGCRDGSVCPGTPGTHPPPSLGIRGTCMFDSPPLLLRCLLKVLYSACSYEALRCEASNRAKPESVEGPHTSDWLELRSPRWAPFVSR